MGPLIFYSLLWEPPKQTLKCMTCIRAQRLGLDEVGLFILSSVCDQQLRDVYCGESSGKSPGR